MHKMSMISLYIYSQPLSDPILKNTNIASDQGKLQSLPEIMPACPPALRCLLFLWEQLCSNCIQAIQTNTSNSHLKDE